MSLNCPGLALENFQSAAQKEVIEIDELRRQIQVWEGQGSANMDRGMEKEGLAQTAIAPRDL